MQRMHTTKWLGTNGPIRFWILIGLVLTFCPGLNCSTDTKKLGQSSNVVPTPSVIPSGVENFRLSFAVRSTSTSSDMYLQGTSESSSSILAVCGSAGTNCVCDFFTDSSNNGLVSSTSSVTYNSTGNFAFCSIPAGTTASTITYARLRDRSNIRTTNSIIVTNQDDADTTKRLTLQKILGGLPATDVRKISEYRCYYNYLKKSGTTTASFSCTDGTLSIAQVPYHYYLYSDNRSNNYDTRVPDTLHNDGRGSLCGALIKFIDCSTVDDGPLNPNELQLKFGIYNRSVGLFTIPVQLTNAPTRMGGVTSVMGYAAKFDTTTLTCPPGFEARQLFTATPSAQADSQVSSSLTDSRYLLTNGAANLLLDEFTGGNCVTTTGKCTAPSLNRDSVTPTNLQTVAYTAQTAGANDRVCVLPASTLSGI